MTRRKTIAARIMHAATKENELTNPVLRRRMRIPHTEMDNEEFNNSILRTARLLVEAGMLKRKDRGTYAITKKGLKSVGA